MAALQETITVDEHIELCRLREHNAADMAELVDTNRVYLARWLDWVEHSTSVADSVSFIRQCQERAKSGEEYGFGIFVDGVLAGHISLHRHGGTDEPEIGYWLDCRQAGRGITTKAAVAVTSFGFQKVGFETIVICAEPENGASNRVAEKAGYVLRGIERNKRIGKDCNVWVATDPRLLET